jgi:hypothetical protein
MKNLWCELEILARLPGKEKGRAIYEHVRGLSPQTLRISTGISSILSYLADNNGAQLEVSKPSTSVRVQHV